MLHSIHPSSNHDFITLLLFSSHSLNNEGASCLLDDELVQQDVVWTTYDKRGHFEFKLKLWLNIKPNQQTFVSPILHTCPLLNKRVYIMIDPTKQPSFVPFVVVVVPIFFFFFSYYLIRHFLWIVLLLLRRNDNNIRRECSNVGTILNPTTLFVRIVSNSLQLFFASSSSSGSNTFCTHISFLLSLLGLLFLSSSQSIHSTISLILYFPLRISIPVYFAKKPGWVKWSLEMPWLGLLGLLRVETVRSHSSFPIQ